MMIMCKYFSYFDQIYKVIDEIQSKLQPARLGREPGDKMASEQFLAQIMIRIIVASASEIDFLLSAMVKADREALVGKVIGGTNACNIYGWNSRYISSIN